MVVGFLAGLAEQASDTSWHLDFANTAWGAIVAALISTTLGVLFKVGADRKLAEAQGEITKTVQEHAVEIQTQAQRELQTYVQAEQAKLQRQLAALQASLSDANNAASARRAYEFDARKRLYEDVEPLLFQMYEGLEEAHYRVLSLARTDRSGNLSGNDNWLERKGYYLASTAYKLLLPAAHLRLLQRRMTFVDFGLDPQIDLRYLLLKLYVRVLTDDFVFAKEAALNYQPNHRDWARLRQADPPQYARQGLLLGTLENIADLLIVEDNGKPRAMSFGEFEGLLTATSMAPSVAETLSLFQGFSPVQKPILACVLVTQACLARFILSTYHQGVGDGRLEDLLVTRSLDDVELKNGLQWALGAESELKAARVYLVARMERLRLELAKRGSSRGVPSDAVA